MRGAGAGRPAKPEGQKVNRHPSQRREIGTVPTRKGRLPAAPPPICELSDAGMAIWKAMWAQPEAVLWRKVDVPALSRLVWLQSSSEAWDDSKLLAELRQLEDRFAMSVQSRHLMGVKFEGPEPEMAAPPPTKARMASRKTEALRLVTGDQEAG